MHEDIGKRPIEIRSVNKLQCFFLKHYKVIDVEGCKETVAFYTKILAFCLLVLILIVIDCPNKLLLRIHPK